MGKMEPGGLWSNISENNKVASYKYSDALLLYYDIQVETSRKLDEKPDGKMVFVFGSTRKKGILKDYHSLSCCFLFQCSKDKLFCGMVNFITLFNLS
jgi:hypothetical protein